MTFYFYWKPVYGKQFQITLEDENPTVRALRRNRAKLLLERLQREGKVPPLSRFIIDVDTDWENRELYPYIPEMDGAYIHVKDRTHAKETPTTNNNSRKRNLRKRSQGSTEDSNSLLPPTKYQKIR